MQKVQFDFLLTAILISMIGFGIAVNYSASSVISLEIYNTLNHFFYRQLLFNGIGIVVAIGIVARFRYQNIRGMLWLINAGTLSLLVMSYIPFFQVQANGAERWINLFGFTFQPSEIVKITIILTLAHMIDIRRKKGTLNKLNDFTDGLVPIMAYVGVYVILVLMQKHLSATGIILIIVMCMLLIGGLRLLYFGVLGAGVLVLGVVAVIMEPFRLRRITGFLNPEANPLGEGYQIIQSWYGLASGEMFGLGLGMSRQKFSWLPENHTDFIVGVIGEEMGFIGISVIILLFLSFLLRGLTVAAKAPDFYGLMVASGIVLLIFFQFAINLSVVSGLFPVTGMPLPFISYGGTSTIILFLALGLLYSVASQVQKNEKAKKAAQLPK